MKVAHIICIIHFVISFKGRQTNWDTSVTYVCTYHHLLEHTNHASLLITHVKYYTLATYVWIATIYEKYPRGFWNTDQIVKLGLFHIVSAQLRGSYTLIYYPFTVALPGLADWSAFLEQVLLTLWNHNYNMPSVILQWLWKKLLKIQQC